MSVTRVVRVTRAAPVTESRSTPQTTTVRRQSVSTTWNTAITSSIQSTGRTCCSSARGPTRALADATISNPAGTARCQGSRTSTDIATMNTTSAVIFAPAGARCNGDVPGR